MMHHRQPIVAIDGPAGSGKSTVAKRAAERTGLQFISSGSMYRAVALRALRSDIDLDDRARLVALAQQLAFRFTTDSRGVVHTFVDGDDVTDALRDPIVGESASAIAVIPDVRAALVAKLQAYGREGGIVMEGRDIQTVVFPDAEIKVFLTASAEERAQRRWKELRRRGEPIDFQAVLAEVCERDLRDTERDASPLRAADDAICVDTDHRTIEDVTGILVQLIETWRRYPETRGAALAQAAGYSEGTC